MTCLSDFALETRADDPHVAACAECRARLQLLRNDAAKARPTVAAILARAEASKPPKRRVWWWAPALAAPVLAAVLFMLVPREEEPQIRVKGGASMRFVAQRGADVTSGSDDARYREGDALRFIVTAADGEYFLLVGLEQSGALSVYYPFGGERSDRVERFRETVLPGSLVLDASPNDEIFLGLFSKEPLDVQALRDAIGGRPHDEATLRALTLPAEKRWVTVHKERR